MHQPQQQSLGNNTGQNYGVMSAAGAWTQYIGQHLDGYDASFGPGQTKVANTYIIPAANLTKFVTGVLGYSFRSGHPGNTTLSRVLPMQNPEVLICYASSVPTIRPMGLDRVNGVKVAGPSGPYAGFQYYKVTVIFTTPPHRLLPDSFITPGDPDKGEHCRYVTKHPKGSAEIIQRQNGALVYDPAAPKVGSTTVNFGPGVAVPKNRFQWVWHQVPDAGLFAGSGSMYGGGDAGFGSIPTNLYSALATVNDNVFYGFPKWTLLLLDYDAQAEVMPVDPSFYNQDSGVLQPDDGKGIPAPIQAPFAWRVTLDLVYFDMNADALLNKYTEPGYTFHGHNLVAHPNGKWYVAYAKDSTTPVFSDSDFTNIFKMLPP